MFNRQSKSFIFICLLAAGILLTQMTLYTVFKLFQWSALANLFDMCNSLLMKWRMPFLALLLDVLVLSTLAAGLLFTGIQLFSYLRAKAKLASIRQETLITSISESYGLRRKDLLVISCKEPVALTMGFFRPVIVLSTGLLQLLDDNELEAVIRHEEFHLKKYDSLRTLITYLLSKSMWYLPILKWCHQCLKISREVLADRYAISKTGSTVGLGSALLKLVKNNSSSRMTFAHASFADTPINVRIKHLIDPQEKPAVKLPLLSAMISLQVIAVLTALLLPAYLQALSF
jgi:beta-lactamase regulating signal transducer with metallopeptidase domain